MRAARYLGVAPWDLQSQPAFWRKRALVAESIEISVEKEKEERAARNRKHGRSR